MSEVPLYRNLMALTPARQQRLDPGTTFERRGDELKRCKDFYLKDRAKIWP